MNFDLEPKSEPDFLSEPTPSPKKDPIADIIDFNEPVQPLVHPNQREATLITEHGTSFTTENSKSDFMSFDEMMNNQKNPAQNPPTELQHSISSKQMTKNPTLSPPSLMNVHSHPHQQHHPHHNMVMDQHQHYGHGHHFAQSPQPLVHHFNNIGQYPIHQQYQNNLQAPQNLGPPKWS